MQQEGQLLHRVKVMLAGLVRANSMAVLAAAVLVQLAVTAKFRQTIKAALVATGLLVALVDRP